MMPRQYKGSTPSSRQGISSLVLHWQRGKVSKIDLTTIEAEDVLASRVFTEGMPNEHQSDTSQNSAR